MRWLNDIQKCEGVSAVTTLEGDLGVEVYRFLYNVNTLKVVGYIAIPIEGDTLPCIIHLRGGSRDFGALESRSIHNEMVRYASEGYVVISTQYPGVEGGDGADAFGGEDDLASIVKLRDILESIPSADIGRIGVKGHSRGGLMAYMLLRQVDWVRAAVIAGAPVDQNAGAREREKWREHQVSLWGESEAENIKRSPLLWAEELPRNVPILLMHGSADWRVDASHSIKMTEQLYKLRHPSRFILFEGADHGMSEFRHEYHNETKRWFKRFLIDQESLPDMQPHGK